ncbi:MAG: hypothetical protein KDA24_24210 [Deltaproteobacteria bacterium]|nr:hypothetical protein [Deltaproteobacteria bacterium]
MLRSLLPGSLVFVGLCLVACARPLPEGTPPDSGELIVRPRSAEGDAFLKLKEGLARQLYDGLDEGLERACSPQDLCRIAGLHVVCSTQNTRDPYVCEIHLGPDGALLAPRDDLELYHSLEANRSYGTARLAGDRLVFEGEAVDVLGSFLRGAGSDRDPGGFSIVDMGRLGLQ